MSNMKNAILEPLYLPSNDFKIFEVGPSKIRITGECAHAGAVSKNGRKYVAEALMKATNTWIGKPCLPNHNLKEVIGNVELMDYKNEALCYTLMVNKPLHVERVREYARNPKASLLRGVSIGANYLYAKCSKCGKSFTEETLWRKHMNDEEFIKDLPLEPHGIVGTDISLVYAPETPGLETSIGIAETVNGFGKLEEILLKEHEPVVIEKKESEGMQSFNPNPYVKEEPLSKEELKKLENAFGSGYGVSFVKAQVKEQVGRARPSVELKPLGEPFAGYADFADCKAKNSDKADPGAYCATIMRATEEVKTADPQKLLDALRLSVSEVDRIKLNAIIAVADGNVTKSRENEIYFKGRTTEAEDKYVTEIKSFEGLLAVGEKNILETRKENQATLTENRRLKESYDATILKLQERAAKAENQLDKVHGSFKGKNADVTKNQGTPSFNRDPYAKE